MDNRSTLLKEIQAEDFALYETALYLNGHPTCKEALDYYCQRKAAATALRNRYEELYGPLTLYANRSNNCWHWVNAPWPWEKEGN